MIREMGKRFLFFCGASIALYFPSLRFPFVNFDDDWIVHAPRYAEAFTLAGLREILGDWSFAARMRWGAEFLPVRDLVAACLYAAFGDVPIGYRIVSLGLYALSCTLLVQVLLELRISRTVAWMAALLFLVHPLHVEPVVWLSSLKDVLSLSLALTAVLAYLRGSSIAAWVAFVLAAFSKSPVLFLPVLFPCIDGCMGRPLRWKAWGAFFLTAAACGGIARHVGEVVRYAHADWSASAFIPFSCFVSVERFLMPLGLHLLYDPPPDGFSFGAFLGVGMMLGGAALALAVRSCLLALAFGAWIASLLPMLQAPAMHVFADRYFLLPSIALCALAAAGWSRIPWRRVRNATFAIAILGLAGVTVRQQSVWKGSVTLWEQALQRGSSHPVVLKNLARLHRERGAWPEALAYYRSLEGRVPRQDDDFSKVWTNHGFVAMQLALYGEAERGFRTALSKEPSYEAQLNLGVICALKKDVACARQSWLAAATIDPAKVQPWRNLYRLSQEVGDRRGAQEALGKIQHLSPTRPAR